MLMGEAGAEILTCGQPRRNHPQLLHHHPPYRLRRERHRQLPSPIRLDFELLVLTHHVEEPVVGFTGR